MRERKDGRNRARNPIGVEVQLRRSGELNYLVRAYHVSGLGCKVEFVERPRVGEILWVKFAGLEALEASVRWIEGFVLGLEFSRPIDARVLEMLLPSLR